MNLKILMLALICFSLNGMETGLTMKEKRLVLKGFLTHNLWFENYSLVLPNPKENSDLKISFSKAYAYFSEILEKDQEDKRPWEERRLLLCRQYSKQNTQEAKEKLLQIHFLGRVRYSGCPNTKYTSYLLKGLKERIPELAQTAFRLLTTSPDSNDYKYLEKRLEELMLGIAYHQSIISGKPVLPSDIFEN